MRTMKLALAALESYKTVFPAELAARMRAKLGLADEQPADLELIESIFKLLAKDRVDYTIFWRRLSHWVSGRAAQNTPLPDDSVRDLFLDRPAFDAWLLQY